MLPILSFSIVSSILYYLLFSLLFILFHNMLVAWCFNQLRTLRTSESFFSLTIVLCVFQSKLFLILSLFTILPYILLLVIRILWLCQFSYSSYYFYLLWRGLFFLWWLLLILNRSNLTNFEFVILILQGRIPYIGF